MKMIDVGEKHGESICCEPSKKEETKKYYPRVYLKVVPDVLWGKDVGSTVEMTVKCKIKSKSANDNGDKSTKSLDLEIIEIGVEGKAKEVDALETEVKRQMSDD